MRVRVLFFGMLKDVLGKASDALDLPDGSTLADLLAHYEKQLPGLKGLLPSLALSGCIRSAGLSLGSAKAQESGPAQCNTCWTSTLD